MFVILYTEGDQKRYLEKEDRNEAGRAISELLTNPEISRESIAVLDPETMERKYTADEFEAGKQWNPLVAIYCSNEECPSCVNGLCTRETLSVSGSETDC